jgi:hypothetical protein
VGNNVPIEVLQKVVRERDDALRTVRQHEAEIRRLREEIEEMARKYRKG